MDDLEMYASGWVNPDEQAQWDHVTKMMAAAGEYDGFVLEDATDSGADDYGDRFTEEIDF